MARQDTPIITGLSVEVKYDNVEQALRKFKKLVQDSGLIRDAREREAFIKPTTKRKKNAALAKRRWIKKVEKDQKPKRMY